MLTSEQVQTLADQAGISYDRMADQLHQQWQQNQQPQQANPKAEKIVTSTFNKFAFALATGIAGGGLIAIMCYVSIYPIGELLYWAFTVLGVILGLAVGTGMITGATVYAFAAAVKSETMWDRVRKQLEILQSTPASC